VRGWLLDTNVISELRKPNPDSKVINFIAAQPGATLFVADVTQAEITYGIEQLGDASRRTDLRLWLERNLRPLFAGRILGIT
jgi:predicted nucleic acid-binding protein